MEQENKKIDLLTAILFDPTFHEAVERGKGDEFIAEKLGITVEEYKRSTRSNGRINFTPKSHGRENHSAHSEDSQTTSDSLQKTPSNNSFEDYWTRIRGGTGEVVPLNFARAHDEHSQSEELAKQYQNRENTYREKQKMYNQRYEHSFQHELEFKTERNLNRPISVRYPSTSPDIIYHAQPPRRAGLLLTGGLLIGIVAGATGVIFAKDTLSPTKTSNPTSEQPYTYFYDRNKTSENEELLGVMSTMVIDVAEEVNKKLNPSPTPTRTPEPTLSPTPDLPQQSSFCGTPDPGKLCRIPPPPPPTPTPYPSCEKMYELKSGDWCIWPTPDYRGPYAASHE